MATDSDKQSDAPVAESNDAATTMTQAKSSDQDNPLDRVLAMKIPVIVKIAEKPMPVSEILRLNVGSVVSFTKDAYQHVDLMVNNTTIGLGQTVKVGEKFGLRITQIGDIEDTIKSLGLESS